jgi:hypothetical protein
VNDADGDTTVMTGADPLSSNQTSLLSVRRLQRDTVTVPVDEDPAQHN